MEKLDYEIVKQLFNSKGYKIIGHYVNVITPVICEKDGYRYKISYHNLKQGKNPSLWGFYNLENLEHNISVLLRKKESRSKFLKYETIIKGKKKRILLYFKCECGEVFARTLEDSVYKTYICCNQCAIKRRGKTKRISNKIVIFLKSKGYIVLDETKPYRNSDYVEVIDKEGFKGFVTYNSIHSKHSEMSRFDIRINKKHYVYNVNHYAELQNIDSRCIELLYDNSKKYLLKFRCSCGNEFTTSLNRFRNGKVRCEICSRKISKYEYIFKEYLEKLQIPFIYQYSLNQCRDILPLPFDFYLVNLQCLIEIDGEGHYYPCQFNGSSVEKAKKTFEITKKHDDIKNVFAKSEDIPLLRIPYYAFTNNTYQELFQNFVREVTCSN